MGQIRHIVICVFSRGDSIFVIEFHNAMKNEIFYRPMGGGIEFGEYSRDALVREVQEEVGAEITHIHSLGALENIFIYNGQPNHEIVYVYDAEFVDRSLYEQAQVTGHEDDGSPFKIIWKPLADFQNGPHPLYPNGLFELLEKSY